MTPSDRVTHLARSVRLAADRQYRLAAEVVALPPAEASRLRELLERADRTWLDADAADAWVMEPLGVLGGRSPAEAAIESDSGLRDAVVILGRIDHGVYT